MVVSGLFGSLSTFRHFSSILLFSSQWSLLDIINPTVIIKKGEK